MHISLSSVCKHTNKFRDIKLNIFSWLSRGGGEIVGEILGGMKGNFGYNEISEFPIFCPLSLINLLTTNCMIDITTNCGIGK